MNESHDARPHDGAHDEPMAPADAGASHDADAILASDPTHDGGADHDENTDESGAALHPDDAHDAADGAEDDDVDPDDDAYDADDDDDTDEALDAHGEDPADDVEDAYDADDDARIAAADDDADDDAYDADDADEVYDADDDERDDDAHDADEAYAADDEENDDAPVAAARPGVRVQKLLAQAGVASRRIAETLIAAGRVTVNGEVIRLGAKADPEHDAIKLDGKRLRPRAGAKQVVLLNKPPGYVSTRSDPEGRPTVLDLLPSSMRARLKPVGRLDFGSEGLLLLTDDGDLAQRVAHPRYGCVKRYRVKVRGVPAEDKLDRLREGMLIDGQRTAPARVTAIARPGGNREATTTSWLEVALSEGRTRQIREMFYRIGHPVARLRRFAIGSIEDEILRHGGWRALTDEEVESLRRGGSGVKPNAKPARSALNKGRRPARRSGGQDDFAPRSYDDRPAPGSRPFRRDGDTRPRFDDRRPSADGRRRFEERPRWETRDGGHRANRDGDERSSRGGFGGPRSARGGRPGGGPRRTWDEGSRGSGGGYGRDRRDGGDRGYRSGRDEDHRGGSFRRSGGDRDGGY
ncbi:MAG: pseudouridine synthase, partial [Acidobacteriota bacterium]